MLLEETLLPQKAHPIQINEREPNNTQDTPWVRVSASQLQPGNRNVCVGEVDRGQGGW